MAIPYYAYDFTVEPEVPGVEILIAQLAELGFESFVERDGGVIAYIPVRDMQEGLLEGLSLMDSDEFSISYSTEQLDPVNWNSQWESNFEPIMVRDRCHVRAPFHPKKEVEFDIVIEPKMSFGTGHHETTFQMLSWLLEEDVAGRSVLDMGCGTAVLAILSAKRGAERVEAIDIDPWCYENAMENAIRNECPDIIIRQGGAELLPHTPTYDLILANINRNILLQDMPAYVRSLKKDGVILFSGFYKEDLEMICRAAEGLGLSFVGHTDRNQWVAAKFVH
jgi:ribosomal protein L11 methyltransferase